MNTKPKSLIKSKLRVGIVVNGAMVDSWIHEMLNIINSSSYAEVITVFTIDLPKSKECLFKRLWNKRNELLYVLYTSVERQLFSSKNNAFEKKHLKLVLDKNIITTTINIDCSKEISVSSIDVLIDFNSVTLPSILTNCAKFGVWKYHHGDYELTRGTCFGVWELFENRNEIGTALIVSHYNDKTDIFLNKTLYATDNYLIHRTRSSYYWNSKSILPRKLEELFELGEETFFDKYNDSSLPSFYYNKVYNIPTNWESMKYIPLMLWKIVKKFISRKYQIDQWIILFKFESKNKIATNLNDFIRILPPVDRFWADPFILKKNDNYYVFIEELLYKEDKGKICVFEINEQGDYTEPQLILERPYHLSYPLLIEDNDKLYMLPETRQNKTIELYECTEFPLKWELKKTLFSNIDALDSTIFKHQNKYWLFTNIENYNNHEINKELHLFYSNDLLGNNWTPHPKNPIVNNLNHSRPAGNIFTYNDKIYRPTQNCTKHYGYGLHIREITKLTETDYDEQSVQEILPNWDKDLLSTHTLNRVNKLTFIDAKIIRNKFWDK